MGAPAPGGAPQAGLSGAGGRPPLREAHPGLPAIVPVEALIAGRELPGEPRLAQEVAVALAVVVVAALVPGLQGDGEAVGWVDGLDDESLLGGNQSVT